MLVDKYTLRYSSQVFGHLQFDQKVHIFYFQSYEQRFSILRHFSLLIGGKLCLNNYREDISFRL